MGPDTPGFWGSGSKAVEFFFVCLFRGFDGFLVFFSFFLFSGVFDGFLEFL